VAARSQASMGTILEDMNDYNTSRGWLQQSIPSGLTDEYIIPATRPSCDFWEEQAWSVVLLFA
jgi:hypothetical protein